LRLPRQQLDLQPADVESPSRESSREANCGHRMGNSLKSDTTGIVCLEWCIRGSLMSCGHPAPLQGVGRCCALSRGSAALTPGYSPPPRRGGPTTKTWRMHHLASRLEA